MEDCARLGPRETAAGRGFTDPGETVPDLAAAARMLPPGRRGRPAHLSTVLRWVVGGVKLPGGDVVRLEARTDFRLEKLIDVPVWHVPADDAAAKALDSAWRRLTGGQQAHAIELNVKGHLLRVPCAAMGVARFSFHDLCERPLGAVDYLRIAHEFHTIVIEHVPVMSYADRNETKRFITLIDTLYDAGVKLLGSAAAKPAALYQGTEGYEASEFKRTASRLIEMGSTEYLALPHGRRLAVTGSSEGIVET